MVELNAAATIPKSKPALPGKTYFYEIDVLRFLAAIMVMLCHFTYVVGQAYGVKTGSFFFGRVIRYGYMTVDLFFMISGYIIVMSAYKKGLKEFITSRIVRLYPAVWITCLLTFAGGWLSGPIQGYEKPSFSELFYNMTLLHDYFGKRAINGVFWTITFEMNFYFLIAIVIGLKLWNNILLIICLWLGYTILAGPTQQNNFFSFLFIPRYSSYMISGMLFFLIQKKMASNWKLYALLAIAFLCSIRATNSNRIFSQSYFHDSFDMYVTFGITTLFYIVMLLVVFRKFTITRFPQLAKLGAITYPLYLIHILGTAFFMVFTGIVNKYILLAGVSGLMIWVAWLIHLYIEKPLAKPLKRKVNQFFDWLSRQRLQPAKSDS